MQKKPPFINIVIIVALGLLTALESVTNYLTKPDEERDESTPFSRCQPACHQLFFASS